MKVVKLSELSPVKCPKGVFESFRYLLKKDSMGFTVTRTEIKKGGPYNWHYKNHLEACLCVEGEGVVESNSIKHEIKVGTMYALDAHDNHFFTALTDCVLICVFNPPLDGKEVHKEDSSYELEFQSPVYNVKAVSIDKIFANDYNPNAVAPPEMELLETSIWEDGYTQPVVTYYDRENDKYIVVDGFHRYLTIKNSKRIFEREKGLLPIVVINKEIGDRMASTIRHNRARGSHNIDLMSNIVAELVEMGKGDAWICKHIGMSKDELLRLKQITGVAALFKNQDFSMSWDVEFE
jgi:quercetin dioxygenase-like cupin family protein